MNFNNKNIVDNKMLFGRKFYRVIDNSYQICLTDGRNHHLAGIYKEPNKIVEVVEGPFFKTVSFMNSYFEKPFLRVRCENNLLHDVLYYSHGLVEN